MSFGRLGALGRGFGRMGNPLGTVRGITISGNRQVGQTLTATPAAGYQWKRNGSNIASATSSTYALTEADAGQLITCTDTVRSLTSSALLIDVYIVFLASIVDPTDATTYSGGVWNAVSFGPAAPNRKLMMGVGGRAAAQRSVTALSMAGNAATKVVSEVLSEAALQQSACMFALDLTTGTSGNISITWSGAQLRCAGSLWAVYGAESSAPIALQTTSTDGFAVPLTTPAGSAAIGYAIINSSTPVWGATLTQDFATAVESTVNHSGAHASISAAQSADFSVDWAGSGNPQSAIFAAWSPAGAAALSDVLLSDAARTWFNIPSTILLGSTLYAGGVKKDGSVTVGTSGPASATLKATLEVDDHDNPSLLQRSLDGKIIAAYSKHSADNHMYVRISSAAGDVSAFGAEADIGSTLGVLSWAYANMVEVTDGIFLFCRGFTGTGFKQVYSKSTDGGVTWSAATVWFDGPARPYFQLVKTGANRFDIICNDDNPNQTANNSIYHFYYDAGTWRKSDGTSIGSPPFTTSQFIKIYDGSTARAWPWDVAMINGKLRAVYAAFVSTTDHRYRYASLSGGVWTDAEICTAGGTLYTQAGVEDYYSGGVCLDPDDETKIYCSRQTSSIHQLFRGVTSDGGANFTMTQLTTTNEKKFRPTKLPSSSSIVYMAGRYAAFTDWTTRLQKMAV